MSEARGLRTRFGFGGSSSTGFFLALFLIRSRACRRFSLAALNLAEALPLLLELERELFVLLEELFLTLDLANLNVSLVFL